MKWCKLLILIGLAMAPLAQALPLEEPVGPATTLAPNSSGPSTVETSDPAVMVDGVAPLPHRRWPLALNVRYGLPLTTSNSDVRSHWTHNTWNSYMGVIGTYWEFPPIIYGDWWFFTGPEFVYQHDQEDLSSNQASSSLTSDTFGFNLNGGLTWQPKMLQHKIGAQLVLALPIWAQRSTALSSPGFNRDLGQKTEQNLTYAFNVFYDFNHHLRPFIGLEWSVSSNIDLGLTYAF